MEIPTTETGGYELAPNISMYDESASKLAFEREQQSKEVNVAYGMVESEEQVVVEEDSVLIEKPSPKKRKRTRKSHVNYKELAKLGTQNPIEVYKTYFVANCKYFVWFDRR